MPAVMSLQQSPVSDILSNRRAILGRGAILLFPGSLGYTAAASANVDVFPRIDEGTNKGNVLTSQVLESIRVKRQIDADSKYDELANPVQTSSPSMRLAAVLSVMDTFAAIRPIIVKGTLEDWKDVIDLLTEPPFEKSAFKRTFNAFADNIYYEKNDPDRANVYLLGGATPTNKQTIQYLYRNDALDNIEQLRTELSFLISEEDDNIQDALSYHDKASAAFSSYLTLIPENEIRDARDYILQNERRLSK